MDSENNHQQDLAGGVDLANPTAKGIDQFKLAALAQKVDAVVMVGQAVGMGAVLFAGHAPGGEIQMLGLLEKAKHLLQQQMVQAQERRPQVPKLGEDKVG